MIKINGEARMPISVKTTDAIEALFKECIVNGKNIYELAKTDATSAKMLRSLITLYTDYSKVSNKKSISINGVFDSGTLSFYVDSKDVIDGLQNHFIASNDSIHTGKKIGRRPGIYKSNYSVFSMPEYTLIRAGKKVESVFEALQFIRANYFGYVNNLEDQSSCVISRDEQKHSDESVLTSAIMPQVLK